MKPQKVVLRVQTERRAARDRNRPETGPRRENHRGGRTWSRCERAPGETHGFLSDRAEPAERFGQGPT